MDQILELLKQQAAILGHAPKKEWWKASGLKPCVSTIQNVFGSWNKALIAAGLEINQGIVTRQILLNDIERVKNELGRYPNVIDYRRLGKYTNIVNHGGWHSLVDELGYPRQHGTRKEDLIKALRQVAEILGRVPLFIEFTHHPAGFSSTIVYKFFGGYEDLLKEAGLDSPQRNGGWKSLDEERLVEQVRQIADDLGHTPSAIEFSKLSNSHANSARYKYGSYSKFLKKAGLKPNRHFTTNDGHVVQSRFELEVDNFLFSHGIEHNVQVRVCPERYWTCDFVVGNAWIECDGYNGQERPFNGTPRFQEKLDYYRKHSYNLIILWPSKDWQSTLLIS